MLGAQDLKYIIIIPSKMPHVSVVVPTRDRSATLYRALASLQRQTLRDIEVLVVDNNRQEAPLDEQPAWVRLAEDSRFVRIDGRSAPNAAAARNLGLETASADWVSYLDDDDEFLPEKLQRQRELALEKEAPLVLCGFQVPLPGRVRICQTDGDGFSGDALLLQAIWGTPFLFHRRPCQARFPVELNAGEDLVFAHRLLAAFGSRHVPLVPLPLVVVHLQPGDRVNRQAEAAWRAQRTVLSEHGEAFSQQARSCFSLRADLACFKHGGGKWRSAWRTVFALARTGGTGEWRRIANALLFRIPWLRRFLVS